MMDLLENFCYCKDSKIVLPVPTTISCFSDGEGKSSTTSLSSLSTYTENSCQQIKSGVFERVEKRGVPSLFPSSLTLNKSRSYSGAFQLVGEKNNYFSPKGPDSITGLPNCNIASPNNIYSLPDGSVNLEIEEGKDSHWIDSSPVNLLSSPESAVSQKSF